MSSEGAESTAPAQSRCNKHREVKEARAGDLGRIGFLELRDGLVSFQCKRNSDARRP
jgi:hypothetical protein